VQDNTTQTTKPEVETTVTHEHLGFKIPRHEEPPKPKVDIRAVQSSITLGNFHFDRGEYDEAIASYQKGLELDPSNSALRQKLRTAISACRTENATLNETNKCGSR
jgi:tetratricopeptide (TPR) repeat protein